MRTSKQTFMFHVCLVTYVSEAHGPLKTPPAPPVGLVLSWAVRPAPCSRHGQSLKP